MKVMNKLVKNFFWAAAIFILFSGIAFIAASFLLGPKSLEIIPFSAQISENSPDTTLSEKKETIGIILVGDIMLDRGTEYMIKKEGGEDFKFPFLKIADYLTKADILFGNLESVISDKGTKVGSIYSFRADPEAIEGLTFAGFDVLSVANNHALDYTAEALKDTLLRLKTAGIDYVGGGSNEKEAYSLLIKELNVSEDSVGLKIGFLSYTDLGPENWKATKENAGIAWINWRDLAKIKNDIEKAKEQTDVLIVSFHSGKEYSLEPTQFQVEFSKMAVDNGADLVVGHHTHIVQHNEKYKNGHIFYGLGNFVFDQSFSEKTMQGQIVKVLIENKEIKEIVPEKIKINNFFQPEITLE